MNNPRRYQWLLFLIINLLSCSAVLAQSDDKKAVRTLIENYGKAMNASNVDDVLTLFARDAVFMPYGHPTAIGQQEIRSAFEQEFKSIDLDVKIVFDEILVDGSLAVVRSRSDGTLKILPKGKTITTESYRAFFVLQKHKNEWRIARFMFNFNNH